MQQEVLNYIHAHNLPEGLGNEYFCAWKFGTALGNNGSGSYNQVINGADYYLQQEWSNASSGCVLHM